MKASVRLALVGALAVAVFPVTVRAVFYSESLSFEGAALPVPQREVFQDPTYSGSTRGIKLPPVTLPDLTITRHLPHTPSPPQTLLIAMPAATAASKTLFPDAALMVMLSGRKVMERVFKHSPKSSSGTSRCRWLPAAPPTRSSRSPP